MLELEKIATRFMFNQDFDRVIEIDYSSGDEYSWQSDDLFHEWKSQNGVGIVAVDMDDLPLGFCVYSLDDKECYEIKHMVVDKCFRRSGIGTSLINRMKDKLNNRRYILSYSIPEDNLGFQLFLKKMGFKAKIVKNGTCDVYRFQYEKE
jgi:ribosomal protein S18 acetylase RimI-like enzyme